MVEMDNKKLISKKATSKNISLTTKKLRREKNIKKFVKIAILVLILLLLAIYLVIGIIYNSGNFTITLDKNLHYDRGLIIYDDPEYKVYRSELYAESPKTYDNISYKWLHDDVILSQNGSHNGDNYLAYTFYIENMGNDVADYYSELVIDDVIRNVDNAVRVRVYKNDQYVTYAKASSVGGTETDTVPFTSDTLIASDHVENFKPGDKIKYTIVLWIEGSDPECNDNILGGEFKVEMTFNSEYVDY